MIYLVPSNGDASFLTESTSRASIPFFQADKARDFILGTEGVPLGVVAVDEETMLVLTRHAAQLFNELPSVITSVPGLMYDQAWMAMGTVLPPTHWKTFEEQTKRSGVLSVTPAQAQSRAIGANASMPVTAASLDEDEVDASSMGEQ